MIPTLEVKTLTLRQLAKTIDHSLLKPEMAEAEIIAGCELARRYDVASVCVKPCYVKLARRLLAGSDVRVGTVVGFPHGSQTPIVKAFEARQAIADGAEELDMVSTVGELKSGHDDVVREDIRRSSKRPRARRWSRSSLRTATSATKKRCVPAGWLNRLVLITSRPQPATPPVGRPSRT
jgi:deoxyribose-phosphate aldolase